MTSPKTYEDSTEFAQAMMARKDWESMLGYVGAEMDIKRLDGGTMDATGAILAEFSRGRRRLPRGTYRVTAPYLPPGVSDTVVMGHGLETTLLVDGNFRPLSIIGTASTPAKNVHVGHFKLKCVNGATNQSAIRFDFAEDCSVENVSCEDPFLNGWECDRSKRVNFKGVQLRNCNTFGGFYHRSKYCNDVDCYIDGPRVFGHEFKSSQFCLSKNLLMTNPRTDYALTAWTGFATGGIGQEIPGELLTKRCGWINPTVFGAPESKHLIYITSSPECFVDGGSIYQDEACVWPPLSVNATSYYNEGSAMSALADGTNIVRNIVDPDGQLFPGARIHFGGLNVSGVNINHTVIALPGDGTATLDTAVPATGTLNIGFVSRCDKTYVSRLRIFGRAAIVGADVINIAGTVGMGGGSADPIRDVMLEGVECDGRQGNRYGLYVSNLATVKLVGGCYENCREGQLRIGPNSTVVNQGAEIRSTVGSDGYPDRNTDGVQIEVGGTFIQETGSIRQLGLVGVNVLGSGAIARIMGGELYNIKTHAAILYDNCAIQNTVIKRIRNSNVSLNGSVHVFGSGTQVQDNFFDADGSTQLDGYIKEEAGALDNHFGPNIYLGNTVKVVLAADSTSSIWGNVREGYGTAAPLTGTWSAGDKLWHSAPFATGPIGFVCVVPGTPGTWRGFGVVLP
jgi:hypothetical protein